MKGGPFRLFENPVCCKISKKNEGDNRKIRIFFEKTFEKTKNENFETVSQCRKTRKGDPLGFLKLQFAAKYQKT